MKPDARTILEQDPALDPAQVAEHRERLGADYFARFSPAVVARHVAGLSRLTREHPVELQVQDGDGSEVECTVLAYDYPFEFSLITGVLAGMGFGILSGDIFTYARAQGTSRIHGHPAGDRAQLARRASRRRIVDHFSGHMALRQPFDDWAAELRRRMGIVMALLEEGEGHAADRAKERVNEWVTQRLVEERKASPPVLYPVQIHTDTRHARFTRLRVVSQDTPAFLYALSNALSLHGISIERVQIRTVEGRIEDEVDFVDAAGQPVRDREQLNTVKLSVLLTKQFTYFLDKAPDPYKALCRFEQMMVDILRLPESGQWLEFLANPRAMQELARLLGASDFIWEDFIRLQYEALLPILSPHLAGRPVRDEAQPAGARLADALQAAGSFEERLRCLNAFKDRELFLIDLDHILNPAADFRALADRLTQLAEVIIRAAAGLLEEHLTARHGRPRTVAGLAAPYAIFGLGKFGGGALGYASDIELLVVYGDDGQTDGPEPLGNAEFFGRLAQELALRIEAKREGIFHVDLRLRPHGNSGPFACSLESFCRYYGPGGQAHSYERLALTRLRAVAGDPTLGARVERLRNEFIYATSSIRLEELHILRHRQFEDKKRGAAYNAKFSPGALVDLEYTVQILQVLYARRYPALQTPRIHEALSELARAGVLDPDEARRLNAAYDFLRRLINGLRMLRGSAQDLFLPTANAVEFTHLARRMGYETRNDMSPSRQLNLDFELRTAAVRTFVEKHFGRDALPEPAAGNVADLVLSDHAPEALRETIFREGGFRNPARAFTNLRTLAGDAQRRDLFAPLAVLAYDMLRCEPDPDMALNNWERFTGAVPDAGRHYQLLLSQPRRLEILLSIFSRSQFLADTLIRAPEFFDWVTNPENLRRPLVRDELVAEWRAAAPPPAGNEAWRDALRRFRRRELLRIGTRDMCLGAPTPRVMEELAILADSLIQAALERLQPAAPSESFCVLALGKLGGRELNYSSDVDLLGVFFPAPGSAAGAEPHGQLMERLRYDLSTHTAEGYVYRVDLRLRPYGRAGEMVYPAAALLDYYRTRAAPWEIQALLKVRPVAGDLVRGEALLADLHALLQQRRDPATIRQSIHHLREAAVRDRSTRAPHEIDIKSGLGGLRDIEFLVQGLQWMNAPDHPEIITGNTLDGLAALAAVGLLDAARAQQLRDDYIFLRRIEHYLQIMEDRQIHALPHRAEELTALARRMLGVDAHPNQFMDLLGACLKRVHHAYLAHISEPLQDHRPPERAG